jgi:hypothetical protein
VRSEDLNRRRQLVNLAVVLLAGCAIALQEVVDPVVGGEETLGVPGRLEPLYLPFSSARGLVGVLGAVV